MKKLVLIDGAAGAGKSDLMEYVELSCTGNMSINILSKITTRKVRKKEEAIISDLEFLDKEIFEAQISNDDYYVYKYSDESYGIKKQDIIDSIEKYEFTFIIIRNKALISRLQEEFSSKALVLHIFIYTDEQRIRERLIKDGYSDSVIEFRLKRTQQVWEDYLTYSTNVIVIINNSNKVDYHRKIDTIISQYSDKNEPSSKFIIDANDTFDLMPSLVGHKTNMQKQLNKFDYSKNVFLMMKFRKDNFKIYKYIKSELEKRGLRCVRADDPDWNITNDAYNPIAVLYCCKYGIALFDKPEEGANYNPNVAYELGVMHSQRKKCLILKHSCINNVPFDLVKDLYVPYEMEIEFEKILEDWIRSL